MKISQIPLLGCSPGNIRRGALTVLSPQSGHIAFLASICEKTYGMMPTGKLIQASVSRDFIGDPLHRHDGWLHCLCACLAQNNPR